MTVVAPDPDPSFAALPVAVHRRPVEAEDLAGMALVVDATGDDRTGRMLARLCRERNLLFNCAADPAQGTALFPAVLRTGRLTAGIFHLGRQPGGCRLGAGISWREFCLHGWRKSCSRWRRCGSRRKPASRFRRARARLLHRCLERALELGRPLNPEELAPLWALEETAHDETT